MVDSEIFHECVNKVLLQEGRAGLPKGSEGDSIIRVEEDDRVLQIVAGPGSGKTEMLTWRVLYEVWVNGVDSSRILVTTFTRRAATELQVRLVERADALIGCAQLMHIELEDPKIHDVRVGTLHSLCDSLLTEFDPGYREAGVLLVDEVEALTRIARTHPWALGYRREGPGRVVNRILSLPQLVALFKPPWEDESWPRSTMPRSMWLRDLLNQHVETWLPRRDGRPNGVELIHGPETLTEDLETVYERWNDYLRENSVVDFAGIQWQLIQSQAQVRPHLSHVFVDEFQDNNPIQFAIHVGWLSDSTVRLTVVGDEDQAIYRFRGSDARCFAELEPYCTERDIPYRQEKLEVNHRGTRNLIEFGMAYRRRSALPSQSIERVIRAAPSCEAGRAVRLVSGPWPEVCRVVAKELEGMQVGRVPPVDGGALPTAAILMFSTSEKTAPRHNWYPPAVDLRNAIEGEGVRVYNPRSKTAATADSEVGMLFGLISYLIDPISREPVGSGGRRVEVWASNGDPVRAGEAETLPPPFWINDSHSKYQKKFRKFDGGTIDRPVRSRREVLAFVDALREELVRVVRGEGHIRISITGFVARVLTLPLFRESGFSEGMFRQALFTQLLEANVAPTRLSGDDLDRPLELQVEGGRPRWANRYWWLLHYLGAFLDNASLDDLEVEAFEENAVPLITFHQAKGLEFDHVYVAATGRPPDVGPALRTRLFSGEEVGFDYEDGLSTEDSETNAMALADRDREVYVALTRGKSRLTVLHDSEGEGYMTLHPAIEQLFASSERQVHSSFPEVTVQEWPDG